MISRFSNHNCFDYACNHEYNISILSAQCSTRHRYQYPKNRWVILWLASSSSFRLGYWIGGESKGKIRGWTPFIYLHSPFCWIVSLSVLISWMDARCLPEVGEIKTFPVLSTPMSGLPASDTVILYTPHQFNFNGFPTVIVWFGDVQW